MECNRAKKPTLKGSTWTGRLNLSSLFRPKQGAWHKRIQLMKGFDFLSTRTTNSVRLIVGSQNSILEIEHFHTYSFQMRESHQSSPYALRAETSFRFQSDRQSSPTEGESDIRPLPVFFFGVVSAIADITRVFAIRASCFYISRENWGDASQACSRSILISGTTFFSQWYFPSSGRSTNENLWERVAGSPFFGPSRLRLSLAQKGELAHRLVYTKLTYPTT